MAAQDIVRVQVHRMAGAEDNGTQKMGLLNQRLLAAAMAGDSRLVQDAINDGACLESRRPLARAWGNLGMKREEQTLGMTALMRSAHGGHVNCVLALVTAKALVNAEEEDGLRPLHFAGISGSVEAARILLEAQASPLALDNSDKSVLGHLPPGSSPTDHEQWKALLRSFGVTQAALEQDELRRQAASASEARKPPPPQAELTQLEEDEFELLDPPEAVGGLTGISSPIMWSPPSGV